MQIVELKSCDLKKLLVIIVLLPASMLFVGMAMGAPTNVSSCQAITSPGEYALNQSIVNSSSSGCINITSSDVIFDGGGYTIDGIDTGFTYGVYVYNSSTTLTNVTVKNLTVVDWFYGIYYYNAVNGSITNNTASSNNETGIRLDSSSNNTLNNNTANANIDGISLVFSSNNNTLTYNNVSSNINTGIVLSSSSYNILTHNIANSNIEGIYVGGSNNNALTDNTANSNSGRGIRLDSSSNNTLSNNAANSNTAYGIGIVFSSNNNTLISNTASSNNWGIYLSDSGDNNTLTNNTANSNNWGIYLSDSSDNNMLTNNSISSNNIGILIRDSFYNILTYNTAYSNAGGIQLEGSKHGILINNVANSNDVGIQLYSSDNNTLTNNNASSNSASGIIFASSSNNNTLTNNTISFNGDGISVFDSSNSNILINNTVSSNILEGISLSGSSNNTLASNNMTGNGYNFHLSGSQESDFNNSIETSNLIDGKPIFYIKNVSDIIYYSSTNAGTFYCFFCNNVTIKDLTLTKNGFGVFLWNTTNSKIENITASLNANSGIRLENSNNNILTSSNSSTNNYYGISLVNSSNNTLSNNTANSNNRGFELDYSSDNILTNNTANSNTQTGISVTTYSNNNTLTNNIVNLNLVYGIILKFSNNNTISNNTANINRIGFVLDRINGSILTNIIANSNFDTGIYLISSNNNTLKNNTASNNSIWDFYSIYDSVNNTVVNLSINPAISFTGKDIALKSASSPASAPSGYSSTGKYISATNNSADSWLFLNVSYSDSDVSNLNESSLRMWKHNGSSWSQVSGTNSVEPAQNYVYANITSFSIFALLGEPISTPPTSPGGGGSGGGGGGGSSGENYTNIESKEKYDLHIYKDNVTSYRFVNSDPILFVNITGNINAGEITALVEVLRNTSTLVKVSAPGTVYKNVNIWVGASGFAVPRNIKDAIVTFRVKNSWLAENNIQADEVFLLKWEGNAWSKLETKVIGRDDKYTYFKSRTDSFPNFAISGIKNATVTTPIPVPATMIAAETPTPAATSSQPAQNMEWAFALIGFIGSATATYYFVIKKQL